MVRLFYIAYFLIQNKMTLADKIIRFNKNLAINNELPKGVEVLNPFSGGHAEEIWPVVTRFYQKYYADHAPRKLILGINPGRLGAGSTGLPFTDTKRLNQDCKIQFNNFSTHEPSSVFVYEVINAFGGSEVFYSKYYIGSVCPLGFVSPGKKGMVNLNYYDNAQLQEAVTPFIVESINQQLDFGLSREQIVVLGMGKNYSFLQKLNEVHQFAKKLVALPHPRFIMQYKLREKQAFIEEYLRVLAD